MKTINKFIVIVLCLLLVTTFFATVSAEESEFSGIVSKTVEASENGDVEVLIDITGNPGITALILEVSYDSDVLTLKENGFRDTGLLLCNVETTITRNPFRLGWLDAGATAANNYSNGTIAELSFEMKEGFYGTTDVTVTYISAQCLINDIFVRPTVTMQGGVISVTREKLPTVMTVNGAEYTKQGKGWAEAVKLANSGSDVEVTLFADWTAEEGNFTCVADDGIPYGTKNGALYLSSGSVTLDLNGNTIDRGLTSAIADGQVFIIEDEATLTVVDNSENGGGKITGGNSSEYGGAFYVDGGTLSICGGEISGNVAENGGGVYMEKGNLYIDGGEISGNVAENGGGIYWDSKNIFCLTGGIISDNVADEGAGIYATDRGEIYLGGTIVISENTDRDGDFFLNFFLGDDDVCINNAAGQTGVPNKPLCDGANVSIYSKDVDFCVSGTDSRFDVNSAKYLHTDMTSHIIRTVYDENGENHSFMLYYNDTNNTTIIIPRINSAEKTSSYVYGLVFDYDSQTVKIKVNEDFKGSGVLEETSLESLISVAFDHDGTEILGYNEVRDFTEMQEFMVLASDGTYTLCKVEIEWVRDNVKIREYSLTLEGSIGTKIYVTLSPEAILNVDDVKATVDYMGERYDVTLTGAGNSDKTLYYAKFYVAAKEMHENITFTVEALGTVKYVTVSVKDYVDYVNDNSAEYGDCLDLINAMFNYGEYSRKYFTGEEITPNPDLSQTELTVSSDYAPAKVGSVSGLSLYASSLLLESNTTIRHYFKLADGASIEDYTFALENKEVLTPVFKDGYYYVDITNILAHKLGETRIVTVSLGEAAMNVEFSALSYVKLVVEDTENINDDLLTLVKALYNYHIESTEYFQIMKHA